MKNPMRLILSVAMLVLLMPSLAFAAKSSADPDPNANPVLAEFIKSGARVFYLGANSGLNGWFITKDNQVQIGYASPDEKSLVIGVQFATDGQNISAQQIKKLYDNNKEVNAFLTNLGNRQQMQAQAASGVLPAAPPLPAAAALASPAQLPPSLPSSPGERLLQALQDAAGVNVGAASAPRLSMVVDPNCPHCQATWQALRAAVFGGKLQIRLVPIGAIDPDSERASAQLLGAAVPLEAWDKYIGGDHSQLAGTPDAARLDAVRNNRALIDAWHIQMTPYIVYRAKDGQVKIVQGEPEKTAAILNDIGP